MNVIESVPAAEFEIGTRGGPAQPLISVTGLQKHFPVKGSGLFKPKKVVRAVDGVDFDILKGETLGVVGESGCGKSTTARLLMQLITPDRGDILFDGETVGGKLPLSDYRRQVQMVFQDSYASLNPRLTIEESISFAPRVHGVPASKAIARAHDLLHRVGLEPARFAGRYPHELSGGQRQRINIARALALEPRLVILDEAVSALDKSVEAQVLNLLLDLKRDFGLTYLFISHDLNVVKFMCDRVMVMYLGKVAEIGTRSAIYDNTKHPYSAALLASMPSMDPAQRATEPPLSGDPPNPIDPPSGCRFHTRCAFAEPVCSEKVPPLAVVSPRQSAACLMSVPGSGHSHAPPLPVDLAASTPPAAMEASV
jgi:peptide/nickel transport system ATP-binding protein